MNEVIALLLLLLLGTALACTWMHDIGVRWLFSSV
jgi:hypothetical protein